MNGISTFRTIFLNRCILLTTATLITCVARDKPVPARAKVRFTRTGILAYTGRNRFRALCYTAVSFAYEVKVTTGSAVMSVEKRVKKLQKNIPFVIIVIAWTFLLMFFRIRELIPNVTVGIWLLSAVPLLNPLQSDFCIGHCDSAHLMTHYTLLIFGCSSIPLLKLIGCALLFP